MTIKKISSVIGALKGIRPTITIDVANKIYKAIIQPHIDYCSTVWDGLGVTLLDKIQKLQNRAARIITQSNYHTSASNLLEELGWDNVSTRWKKQKAILMFKTLLNIYVISLPIETCIIVLETLVVNLTYHVHARII